MPKQQALLEEFKKFLKENPLSVGTPGDATALVDVISQIRNGGTNGDIIGIIANHRLSVLEKFVERFKIYLTNDEPTTLEENNIAKTQSTSNTKVFS